MKKSLMLVFSLLLLLAAAGSIFAQSTDRDHPTPLKSAEINGDADGSGDEYFYSFVAGPGKLTIMVDVKSEDGTVAIPYELLDKDANEVIICCAFAQANTGGESGRSIESAKLKRRQTVILHLTMNKSYKGTYRVRLSGATELR
ncbi:MAG: hypothetical protein QOH51_1896 [Acidobacteriota bacterium]|jgi:hypothetical protein|nr:hypothetical protein [Acidobacteriota bacterium]